jgi:uncharacterized protein YbbC (DUF1343 family)
VPLHRPRGRRAAAALAALAALAPAVPAAPAAAQDAAPGPVAPGVEVLLRDSLHLVRGKRVGLITNHTGRDRAGTSTVDLLARAPGVRLTALFAAEHGIRGAEKAGAKIAASIDSATGVPIRSLYGETRVPTRAMLRDLDVLVYDIQDVGARVYTYQWTMALAAAAADSAGVTFVVLDRPDPVRADRVDGGVLDPRFASFVGLHPVATRYGLTAGELLRWLQGTGRAGRTARVVPMQGYRRAMWWDETGLAWANPSPNLRDLEATTVYTGTVFFEGTNVTEGRGTDAPFKQVGAPWLTDAAEIAAALNARNLPGVRFDTVTRVVEPGYKFGGDTVRMVAVRVTDRDRVRPDAVGLWMLREIRRRHPREFQWRVAQMDRLAGSDRARRAVDTGDDAVRALLATYERESRAFAESSRRYHLYP